MRIYLIVLTLFILGCGQVSISSSSSNVEEVTGYNGLTMSFFPNSPPDEMYDEDEFIIMAELHNEGAVDIDGASGNKVYLTGFDDALITGVSAEDDVINVKGKSFYDPLGGRQMVKFTGQIESLESVSEYEPALSLVSCYLYETLATGEICIDKDPNSQSVASKVCYAGETLSFEGQGAPVAVTRIETLPREGVTVVKIFVENKGNGRVINQEKISECDGGGAKLTRKDYDLIEVTEILVGDKSLNIDDCTPLDDTGNLRLVTSSQAGFFTCKVDTSRFEDVFLSPIVVKLKYGYRDSISKTIKIVKTPE